MTGTRRVPRSRGALCGALLVLLGLWGGLLPFAGPYADFGFAPDRTWFYTTERLQLSVAPAIAVGLGGLVVLVAAGRVLAMTGALLAALGGAWFVVGRPVAALWDVQGVGAPLGTEEGRRLAEDLSGFSALGVVAVFLAALALGRFAVAGARDAEDYGGYGDDGHEEPYDAPRSSNVTSRYSGSSGTTQPLAPAFGRYARPPQDEPPGPPHAPDQRVAGDPGPRA
ncbi:hypothetical protein [Actinomadura rugatobispora]|uniref:Trp biosynthesis-associated membrane protein n=1 Tax=Actinomadura rugatobispora TaxID=1994 RepID=A0ABW0ZZ41_9ACTN|nr:hypothetical protein GCM10010200_076680 [Actinomadura rugatobispora]